MLVFKEGGFCEHQHHDLPADQLWWLIWCINTFYVYFCVYVGVLSTASRGQ